MMPDTPDTPSRLLDPSRHLDAIINNTSMALFVMDERQQCVFMNRAAETLTGYTLAETRGRTLHDVVARPYTGEQLTEALRRVGVRCEAKASG